ncbi:nucleotide-binding protein [Frigoribacterium sp. CFBP 13605]|uniref:TIR domain-containing protein n=1 Tax=Frigoribacterium sp. CFBP 13605 TaxID=2774034 RepID=UPI0019087004|nr:nucleotide-binding protein [Frigoribacterium sp. CFBP 13605]MBD8140873.1 nucleotide-binding protein [Frigoribacterium sp. CFBP 13605]
MAQFSGPTRHSLAELLAEYATHTVIESLFVRFEVPQLPSDTNPNKLKKTTRLVEQLGKRAEGRTSLQGLIDYITAPNPRLGPEFRRGSAESQDFYQNLDQDLATSQRSPTTPEKATPPQRQFARPGTTATDPAPASSPNAKRYVFVVRGRDNAAYEALVAFLKALDLRVVTWDEAVRGAGGGSPYTLEVVRAGMDIADAVVVLLTPDDLGHVKGDFYNSEHDDPREAQPSGQARQNVIFEAGWAMALDQKHVILLLAGTVRMLSDIDGLNYVRITDDISDRKSLITRLRNVQLEVDESGEEWRTAGSFPSN